MESFSNGSPKSTKEESATKLERTESENISAINIQFENDDKTPTAVSPVTPQRPSKKKNAITDSKNCSK